MQTVFIKFSTQQGRVRGFYELATRSRINSLLGFVSHGAVRHGPPREV
jgi:hypothetical protein